MIDQPLFTLLDTNIVLHLARGNEIGRAIDAAHRLAAMPDRPLVSIITEGELFAFAKRRNWGQDRLDVLGKILEQFVVAGINRPVVKFYAEISAFLARNGRSVGENDRWIAATAAANHALLVTTDADFDPLDQQFLHLSRFELPSSMA